MRKMTLILCIGLFIISISRLCGAAGELIVDGETHLASGAASNVGIGVAEATTPEPRLEVNNSTMFTREFGASAAVDWRNGNKQTILLGGNAILTFTAPVGKAANFLLRIVQDGTGGRTVTSWTNANNNNTVRWSGGTAPALSTAANAEDIVSFYYNGTNYYGSVTTDFK